MPKYKVFDLIMKSNRNIRIFNILNSYVSKQSILSQKDRQQNTCRFYFFQIARYQLIRHSDKACNSPARILVPKFTLASKFYQCAYIVFLNRDISYGN